MLLMGCTNKVLLKNNKIILDNVYEINFETAHNGIQIELDNMEFKTIEIFGPDLGIVLFKYNKFSYSKFNVYLLK